MIALFSLFFLPFVAMAAEPGEEIRSFASDITVAADGSILVSERIEYDFPSQRHGIYRDIPTRYEDENGGRFVIPVKVASVGYGNGTAVPYGIESNSYGVRVKIGDPNRTITGVHTYVIVYSARGALRYYQDHDELYWNVTGTAWQVPIRRAVATVRLPENIPGDRLALKCFTGAQGSTSQDCLSNRKGNTAEFAANDALTVVVGWPPGLVARLEPEKISPLASVWPVFIPILTLVWLIRRWWKQGRDAAGRDTLMVQYDPPDKLTPAELGVLIDEKADLHDISATIVDMAVRGYIKIREVEVKGLLSVSKDFEFELRKPFLEDAALKEHEKRVLTTIFSSSPAGTNIRLQTLKNAYEFNTTLPKIKHDLYASSVANGYFPEDPDVIRGKYVGMGVLCLIIGFLAAVFVGGYFEPLTVNVFAGSVVVSGVFFLIFAPMMPRRTEKGTAAFEHAVGFQEYLEKAEKYRLEWQEKEKAFEFFLPYAMVFGVVAQWTKAFKDMDMKPPDWYEGSAFAAGHFNAVSFGSMMRSLDSSVGQAMSAKPQQSSGGSGFGGGGHSGGGGGGGGGGSW